MPDLSRLFRPRSVAVFGGWWAENVVTQCLKSGFDGDIWPIHPSRDDVAGVPCFRSLADLPAPPDAAFLGINRHAVIEVTAELAAMGCGGAVCFASGFAETGDIDLQEALIAAAGEMPLLGPNCYGVLNYLDGAMLWPDQHGGRPVERGIAIISQSSNIAINISMQARGLPIAYIACVGNQAQTSLTDMTRTLLDDDRVTAAGLYIEGIHDPVDFADMAAEAAARGKAIIAIKSGKTTASANAASSHTAALAGDAAASSAFLAQTGVIEADGPEDMLETLKLLHLHGRFESRQISENNASGTGNEARPEGPRLTAMCCSGGEAGLLADLVDKRRLSWPDIPAENAASLAETLGPLVTISNPLDYQTFIWGDEDAMMQAFAGMMGDWVDLSVLIIDFPRADRCSDAAWHPAVAAMKRASALTGTPVAMLGSLAEGISDDWAIRMMADGIVPLCGLDHGLRAIELAYQQASSSPVDAPHWRPFASAPKCEIRHLVDEASAKSMLSAAGLTCPKGVTSKTAHGLMNAASNLRPPLALKGLGSAHKTEAGLVKLGLMPDALETAADSMVIPIGAFGDDNSDRFLVEEMAPPPIAELLVGARRDPVYGASITIGMGGMTAELLGDVTTLVLPVDETMVRCALLDLKLAPLLTGYRGRASADIDAAIDAILKIADLLVSTPHIDEIEINPLMLAPTGGGALAVDAVMWCTTAFKENSK